MVLSGLNAFGWLTPKNKLGIVVEQCSYDQAAYTRTVKPLAATLHLTIAKEFSTSGCATGFGDAARAANEAQSAQLAFRSAGVDRVMIISNFEPTYALLFGNVANSQGYHPGYALSSAGGAAVLASNLPADQVRNIRGVGSLPAVDVAPSHQPPLSSQGKRCDKILRGAGLNMKSPADFLYGEATCDTFFEYERALLATHGRSELASITSALAALGPHTSAAPLDGATSYTRSKHNGPDDARVITFDAKCSCLTYTGPTLKVFQS